MKPVMQQLEELEDRVTKLESDVRRLKLFRKNRHE
jgi:hypothetical protein